MIPNPDRDCLTADVLTERVAVIIQAAARRTPPVVAREADLSRFVQGVDFGLHLQVRREVALAGAGGGHQKGGRADFCVADTPGGRSGLVVAVELKVAGTLAEVTRQLFRYAEDAGVCGVVLVTTRARHDALPDTLLGKPLRVVVVGL